METIAKKRNSYLYTFDVNGHDLDGAITGTGEVGISGSWLI
jgi:hypothetical protein